MKYPTMIPVSIWIGDIDFEEVEKRVEDEVGLSRRIIDQRANEHSADYSLEQLAEDVQTYIDKQISIAREMLTKSNNKFVDDFLSGAEDVYVYEVFPIIDCSITRERIICLSSLDSVESISSNADKDIVYPTDLIDMVVS